MKVRITARYRLHPLPFGCQRPTLLQILQKLQWAAKPLQPDKGTVEGAAWLVGACTEPPALALPFGGGHILVTKVQDHQATRTRYPAVLGSTKTRKHIQLRHIQCDDPDDGGVSLTAKDPWQEGPDPWARARIASGFTPPPGLSQASTSSASTATTKLEQLGNDLRQDLRGFVQAIGG